MGKRRGRGKTVRGKVANGFAGGRCDEAKGERPDLGEEEVRGEGGLGGLQGRKQKVRLWEREGRQVQY